MAPRRRAAASAHRTEGVIRLDYDALGTVSISTLVSSAQDVLQDIIRSAPPGRIPSPLPASRDDCLSAVLALRDEVLASTYVPAAQDSSALEKLVSMTGADIMELGTADSERLISLMRSAARHDPTLVPALPRDADGAVASMTAMVWKLSATEEALNQVRLQGPEAAGDAPASPSSPNGAQARQGRSPSLLARLQGSLSMPSSVPLHVATVPVSDEPPPKQRRLSSIGGVPVRKSTTIPDSEDVGQVFRQGLGGGSLISPSQLGVYPGRGSSTGTLRVGEIAGPSILLGLVQEGLNVELAIRNRFWKRGNGGEVLASEAEALTLARIIHLNLLAHPTMTEALEQCPWMEVALRLLFAIMYVENSTSSGASNAAAWQVVQKVLEIHPTASIRVPTLDSMLAGEAAASVKEMNALAALSKRKGSKRYPEDKTDKRK